MTTRTDTPAGPLIPMTDRNPPLSVSPSPDADPDSEG